MSAFAASNLSVVIEASPDPATEGGQLQYIVTGNNAGPDPASSVTAEFTHPENVIVISSISDGAAGCGAASENRVIACGLGSIASGDSATATITVRPNAGTAGTTLASQANIFDVLLDDPEPGNNSASNNAAVRSAAGVDLAVTISDSPDPVEQGSDVTLSFTIRNDGAEDAQQSTLSVAISQGFFGASTSSAGSCAAGGATFDCDFGVVGPGETITVTLAVTTSAAGTLTTTANVATIDDDTNAGNNQASEDTTVAAPGEADLSVSQTISPDPVTVGNSVSYELIGSNAGPAPASGVVITDLIPASVNYVSGAVSAGGTGCTYDDPSRTVTCGLGNLPVGGEATATLQLTATEVGEQTSIADISGVQGDPNTANNTSSESHQVAEAGAVDLAVSISDTPDPAVQGDTVTVTTLVSNSGPAESTQTTVEVGFSQGLISTVTPATGSCTTGATVVCNFGTLATDAGTQVVIEVVTTSSSPNNLVTTATVSANEVDSNSDDNSAEETTIVAGQTQADLVLRMESLFEPVAISGRGSYPLTLTNRGPAAVVQPSAVVVIPENTFFISGLNAEGVESCTVPENGTTNCFYGNIAADGEETITLVFAPDVPLIGESYTVEASVTLANDADPDPSPESNSASRMTEVVNFGVDVTDLHPRSGSPVLETISAGDNDVVMAVFSVDALHHDTEFQSVTVFADGSGIDDVDVAEVKLLLDSNANGYADVGEPVVASGRYSDDQDALELVLDTPRTIARHGRESYLVLYDFSSSVLSASGFQVEKLALTNSRIGVFVDESNVVQLLGVPFGVSKLAERVVNSLDFHTVAAGLLSLFTKRDIPVLHRHLSGSDSSVLVAYVISISLVLVFVISIVRPLVSRTRLILMIAMSVTLGCGGEAGEFKEGESTNLTTYRVFVVDMKAADVSSGFLFFVDGLPFASPGVALEN